jgi:hypothetical protein
MRVAAWAAVPLDAVMQEELPPAATALSLGPTYVAKTNANRIAAKRRGFGAGIEPSSAIKTENQDG